MVRDALTGVYAKVALFERLEEEVHRGRRYGEPFSVLMLDLDHFKSVNDAFGHARGDATLTEFVNRVHTTARNSDVLFRYGGDEFVLFLPRTTHDHATILADRLVEQIKGAPFGGQPPLSITVSAGVATLPDDGSTVEELLARADARMYEAKRAGRARAVSVDPTRDAELLLDEGTRLIERLDALDRANRFFDTLPSARSGVLRIVGSKGSGRSRVSREIEKLAGLRGHRVISIAGQRQFTLEPLSALREACSDAAQISSVTEPAEVAYTLRRAFSAIPNSIVTITIDNVAEVDRPTLEVVRVLLSGARAGSAIGVVHTGTELEPDPAPSATPLRDTIELRPLTRDGVRAWMRSLFRWEPALEFVEWVHAESGGYPGAVRRILLQLVEQRVLIRDDTKWSLAESFHELVGSRTETPLVKPRGVEPPLTSLVGREGPLRQLLRLLRTTHLVTVVGPGGIGKTRLAVEVAFEASESFRDGVAFVRSIDGMSALQLATAIAGTLNISPLGDADPWTSLARALRTRRMLLVLDGYEETPDTAAGLSKLMRHAPDLRLLVTARARLHIKEEWVFHLEGLRVPKWPEPERARGFGSTQLFVERATAANPHFAMGEAETPSVARICQLLDGAPLAIEIAAAQSATLSCREIANDLETSIEGYSSYLPATPPDQQRFRAIMDQTWRLLPEEDRSLLRRVAAFAGEFDALAAIKIAGVQPAQLDSLVSRALATRNAAGRYAIHPLVRDYAVQKLDEFSRDRHELLSAFAVHYLELARELGEQLRTMADPASPLMEFTADLPNIRRAWLLALADREFVLVLAGARALYDFFSARHYNADAEAVFADGLGWLGADVISFSPVDDRITSFLFARHGAVLLKLGRIEEGRRRLTVALSKTRRLALVSEEAFCLRCLALVEQGAGNANLADEYARAAILLARQTGDPRDLILALHDGALAAASISAFSLATEYLIEASGIEVSTTAKMEVWRGLVDLAEQLAQNGNIVRGAATLLHMASHSSVPPEMRAEAERLMVALRAADTSSIEPHVSPDVDPTPDSSHELAAQVRRPQEKA